MIARDEPDDPEKVAEAVRWLAETPRGDRGEDRIVPTLCRRFGLSAVDACRAIGASHELTRNAK